MCRRTHAPLAATPEPNVCARLIVHQHAALQLLWVVLGALAAATFACACSGADASPMVRARAAADLVCAESTVAVRRDLDGTYTAVGCGKVGHYRAVCEGTRCAVSGQGEPLRTPAPQSPAPEPEGMYGPR
jgi:hypothetical protein